MAVTELILYEINAYSTDFSKTYCCAYFHETPTNCSVADARLQKDGFPQIGSSFFTS
jgi:hypothetical protein